MRRPRPASIGAALALALALALAGCSSGNNGLTTPTAPPAETTSPATPAATAASPVAASPVASPTLASPAASPVASPTLASPAASSTISASPVASPALGSPGLASPAASPAAAEVDAIKAVIQRANQEQQQAMAAHDPSLMRDTATAAYYDQLVQGLAELANANVTAIQLVNLQWGPIVQQGPNTAQATTLETWRTTFAGGPTLQQTDTNVYTLVREGGAWKIQDDQHPDTRRLQPPSGPPGAAPTAGAPGAATPAPLAPGGQGQSRNWSGYAATGGTFTAVAGTWTVPTVTAGNTAAADSTWVGIGGVTATDLIQAGTQATVQGGQVAYSAWVEILPRPAQPVSLTVSPGDQVTVTIAQQADGTWVVTIRDGTTGQSYQASGAYASSRSSAEWIEESPTVGRRSLLPLDDFGAVTFTGATTVEDGQQRSIAQAGGQPITMTDAAGQTLARPSALAAGGSGFTVTRTSTPAPGTLPGSGALPPRLRPN